MGRLATRAVLCAMVMCISGNAFAQEVEVRRSSISKAAYDKQLIDSGAEIPVVQSRAKEKVELRTKEENDTAAFYDVIDYASALQAEEIVDVVIETTGPPLVDLRALRKVDPATRTDALAAKEKDVLAAQESLTKFLRWHGATLIQHLWVRNEIRVKLPAHAVEAVLAHQDILNVYPAWGKPVSHGTIELAPEGWDGAEIRSITGLQDLVDLGYNGESGGRLNNQYGGNNVKIAVIEALPQGNPPWPVNFINESHPGWKDWAGGPSRIEYAGYMYDGGPFAAQNCSNPPSPQPSLLFQPFDCNGATHGTLVTSLAAGSIEQNQDPNITNAYQQSRRSGVAQEASILYFSGQTYGDFAWEFFAATIWGADVVNMSWGASEQDCNLCDPNCNPGNVNGWFRSLADAGAITVTSAGNENNDQGQAYPTNLNCNVTWPAYRPEVVAVGGVNVSDNYFQSGIGDYSSRGWLPVDVGGWAHSLPGVDFEIPPVSFVAPGSVKLYYSEDSTYSDTSNTPAFSGALRGTSVATPVASGAFAVLRHAYPTQAQAGAGEMRALMLSMARGDEDREVHGVGRVHTRHLNSLQQPANWYTETYHLNQYERVDFTFPGTEGGGAGANFRLGVYIDTEDLDQIPWIYVTVYDSCNGSQLVVNDLNPGLEKLLNVSIFDYFDLNTACLEVQVYGTSVASGGTDVSIAGYFHNQIE